MSKYILYCPVCGSYDLEFNGEKFECVDCEQEFKLEDLDFESED